MIKAISKDNKATSSSAKPTTDDLISWVLTIVSNTIGKAFTLALLMVTGRFLIALVVNLWVARINGCLIPWYKIIFLYTNMIANRQRTVNNLQLSELMKNESPNLYPFITQVYNRGNGNIPPNKIIYLAKIIRRYPPEIQNDIIRMYLKSKGDVSNSDINLFVQSKLNMRNEIKNEMRKSNKNNINKFIQIVKSKGERGKNSKKLTAGEWEAFSKLWFEVHPDSNITYNKVLTNDNKSYYNSPRSLTKSKSGLGIGLLVATTVATAAGLLITGKI